MDQMPWLFEDSQRADSGDEKSKVVLGKSRIEEPQRAQGVQRRRNHGGIGGAGEVDHADPPSPEW